MRKPLIPLLLAILAFAQDTTEQPDLYTSLFHGGTYTIVLIAIVVAVVIILAVILMFVLNSNHMKSFTTMVLEYLQSGAAERAELYRSMLAIAGSNFIADTAKEMTRSNVYYYYYRPPYQPPPPPPSPQHPVYYIYEHTEEKGRGER